MIPSQSSTHLTPIRASAALLRSRGWRAAVVLASALTLSALSSCSFSPSSVAASLPDPQGAPNSAADAQRPEVAIDADATNYPYPFPVQFAAQHLQQLDLRIAYMDVAPTTRTNHRTVVLMHGKNFSGAYWEPTIRALAAEGYRVVVPDMIGFGKSSKPAHFQFSFAVLAESTQRLLDLLQLDRIDLVGHSMGGMLAVRFALMFPERVDKLALVNPIGLEDWSKVVPYRSVDAEFFEALHATPDSIREYERKNYFAGRWKPEYDALIALQAGWTRHPDYPRVAWCSALTSDMIFTQPVVNDLRRIRTPTLLIIGQRDRTAIGRERAPQELADTLGDYPSLGRKAAAAIPGAKLVEIEDAGHLPQVDSFQRYKSALLAFLRRENERP